MTDPRARSLVHGRPLQEEAELGALTIPGYLGEVVQRFGPREALVMHDVDGARVSWSYQDLWTRALEVARALIAAGVDRQTRVGVLMTNRPEHVASLFGVALAGGVVVSLSTFSTPPELEYLLRAGDVSILLFDRQVLKTDFAAVLGELLAGRDAGAPVSPHTQPPPRRDAARAGLPPIRFPYLRRLVALDPATHHAVADESAGAHAPDGSALESWSAFLAGGAVVPEALVAARARLVSPAEMGGLFFSSGTTSLPKGIIHAQRAFAIQWWRWPRVLSVKEPVRSWTGNGFFWSANVSMVLGTAFSTGGAVVLQPTFEAEAALWLIERERVSLMNGRPHQWARMREARGWSTAELGSVRYVTRGELIREHPTVTSTWERPNSYGTTETMTIFSAFTADTPAETRAGSFGAPLPGNAIKVVDPRTGAIVPRGERGELCLKGPTTMLGYVGKAPEEAFDDEGYLRTGDGGYVDAEGRVYWEGRLNYLIKTGGANVSPEEVDAAIGLFPGIKHTQTVGVPHPTMGELVVSCVVPAQGAAWSETELLTHLRARLASFKVPRRVLVVDQADFALTGNGKVKVDAIRALAARALADADAGRPGG